MGVCLASHLAQRTADRLAASLCACVTLELTSPNGGTDYDIAETVPITWTTTGQFASFDIHVQRDGGEWTEIVSGLAGSARSYNWAAQAPPAAATKIRVTGYQPDGITDESDAAFEILAPPAPWAGSVANVRMGFLAANAVDSGAPDYNITSQPDEVGGSALVDAGAPFMQRLAPPAARYGATTNIVADLVRVAGATMRGAVESGDHSFALRGRPLGASPRLTDIGVWESGAGNPYAYLWASDTSIAYGRYDGSTIRGWSVTGLDPIDADEDHYFAVSVNRVDGTTTVCTFYRDGVAVGSDSDTTLDITFVAANTYESIGRAGFNLYAQGAFVGGHMTSHEMTEQEHLDAHLYYQTLSS